MNTNHHSTSEVGHAKNIANLQKMINYLQNYGAAYNPINTEITIPTLISKHTDATKAMEELHIAKADYIIAVNSRQQTFETLKETTTRIANAIASMTSDKRIFNDARTFINKIRGKAPKTKTIDNQENQEVKIPRSNSQQSYDNLVNHFQGLIELLDSIPFYAPNEADITVPRLRIFLSELQSENQNIIPFQVNYSQKLIDRNQILYNPITGIVASSKQVKQYVKSVFGVNSSQFGQINPIEFRTLK